jgi:hypothetical protein
VGGIFAVLLLIVGLGSWWYANSIFNRIDKVDVSSAQAHGGGGTNYLIVGSDSAEVLDESNPAFDPARPDGQRSDTMMLLRFEDGKAKILSVPRAAGEAHRWHRHAADRGPGTAAIGPDRVVPDRRWHAAGPAPPPVASSVRHAS